MKKEEEKETVIIEPFEGCNFQVEVNIPKKKEASKLKPFPHNMQFNNMQLLQEKYYHLFDGDAAIYIKDAEYIEFDYLLYDIPFFKMGNKMKILGYRIMLCNPHFSEKQLYECLHHTAVNFIHIPKDKPKLTATIYKEGYFTFMEKNRKRIEIAAEQIMNKPFKGKIKKQPKMIYNPDYDLTTQDKREVANELQGNKKSNNTLEQIYTTLLNWNKEEGKVTQKKIAAKLDKSESTIQTYWKTAKQELSTTI